MKKIIAAFIFTMFFSYGCSKCMDGEGPKTTALVPAINFQEQQLLLQAIDKKVQLPASSFFLILPKDVWHLIMNRLSHCAEGTRYLAHYASIDKALAQKLAPQLLLRCAHGSKSAKQWFENIAQIPLFLSQRTQAHALLIQTLMAAAHENLRTLTDNRYSERGILAATKATIGSALDLLSPGAKQLFQILMLKCTRQAHPLAEVTVDINRVNEALQHYTKNEILEVEHSLSLSALFVNHTSSFSNWECIKVATFAGTVVVAGPLTIMGSALYSLIRVLGGTGNLFNAGTITCLALPACYGFGLVSYFYLADKKNTVDYVFSKAKSIIHFFITKNYLKKVAALHPIITNHLENLQKHSSDQLIEEKRNHQ